MLLCDSHANGFHEHTHISLLLHESAKLSSQLLPSSISVFSVLTPQPVPVPTRCSNWCWCDRTSKTPISIVGLRAWLQSRRRPSRLQYGCCCSHNPSCIIMQCKLWSARNSRIKSWFTRCSKRRSINYKKRAIRRLKFAARDNVFQRS